MSFDPLLLQMLGNNGNHEQTNSLLSMLQNQESLSPKAKMLLQIMSSNQSESEDDSNEMEDVIELESVTDSQRLNNKIDFLQNQLNEAREMIDVLAEAIGACPDCFGGLNDCPDCHGHGIAGWQKPDPKLFSHFIAPALRRLKQRSRHSINYETPVRHNLDRVKTHHTPTMQKGDNDV